MFGGAGVKGFGGSGSEIQGVSLNLTALMDILSNLLFFLMASYTAQSLEVKQKADLHLPISSSQLSISMRVRDGPIQLWLSCRPPSTS